MTGPEAEAMRRVRELLDAFSGALATALHVEHALPEDARSVLGALALAVGMTQDALADLDVAL